MRFAGRALLPRLRGVTEPPLGVSAHAGDDDIHQGDKVNEAALKDLIRAAVALNLMVKSNPSPGERAVPTHVPFDLRGLFGMG